MRNLSNILVVLSFITFVSGMLLANGAPQEAVSAAGASFLAILARIAQATSHHSELLEKLSKPAN